MGNLGNDIRTEALFHKNGLFRMYGGCYINDTSDCQQIVVAFTGYEVRGGSVTLLFFLEIRIKLSFVGYPRFG